MKYATNYYKTNKDTRNTILKRFSMFDGVGLDLTGAKSYDEALEMSGLDYTADKVPLYLADGTKIENHFGVAKSDNPACILGIVGNQYHAVGNREAFAVAENNDYFCLSILYFKYTTNKKTLLIFKQIRSVF